MIAVGAEIASITFENTSSSAQTNLPVTFGQVFAEGDLPATGAAVELKAPDNSVVPCQLDVRRSHPDGSVRHAVLSAIIPALGASATVTYGIVRKSVGSAPAPAVPADFAGLDAVVTWTEGGTVYSASLASLLAGSKTTWLSGNVASEWEFSAPLKTADGAEHAHLHVRFVARAYKGQNKARIDIAVENTWAWDATPQDVTGDVAMTVGGVDVFSQTGLVHHPRARYRKLFWWNASEPTVHIAHNIDYLIASHAIPNYDRTVVPGLAQAATYKTASLANNGPMKHGIAYRSMPSVGGRADIGLLPGWTALYLISMNKDIKEAILTQGGCAGSWSIHFRDRITDRPISFNDWPYFSVTGSTGDNVNPATGQSEKAPSTISNTTANVADIAHHPDQAYIPYLVTGDVYYLEELQFWATYCVIYQNGHANYRAGKKGLMYREQIRAQAWAMRTFAHAAYITPEGAQQAEFEYLLKTNIDWYDARYTNNSAEDAKLGAVIHKIDYAATTGNLNGIANWQDDFITSVVGRSVELGFEFARPFLMWKSKYTVARLYGVPGACWVQAAAYRPRVRDTSSSPIYTTYKEVYDNTMSPAVIEAAAESNCATQAMADAWAGYNAWAAVQSPVRGGMDGVSNPEVGDMDGYSNSTQGYPSNLQGAIAYCATFAAPDAGNAWEVFDGRTVKPDYSTSPQFAITPRAASSGDPDPIPDPQPTGTIMAIADRVKVPTTTTGTLSFSLGEPDDMNFNPFVTPPIEIGSVVPYLASHRSLPEWETGMGTLTGQYTLERTTIKSNSNGDSLPVNFSAGIKDVSCVLTSFYVSQFARADDATVAAIANPATSTVIVEENGVTKRIAVADLVSELGGGTGTGVNPDDVSFLVVGCEGQSNMANRGNYDALVDVADARIWQFGCTPADARYRTIFSGADPMHTPEGVKTGKAGIPTAFARTLVRTLPTNIHVLLVPLAYGATALVTGSTPRWKPGTAEVPGGDLFENAITQVNLAIAAAKELYPNSRYFCTISHQGEQDAFGNITQAAYATAKKLLISGLRSRITGAQDTPYIIGGMVPEMIAANLSNYGVIDTAHRQVATEVAKCAFVEGPTGHSTPNDIVHYLSTGSRILGTKMALAVRSAMGYAGGEVAPAAAPAQMAAPVATVGVASASIAFVAPANGGAAITGYTVTASTGQTATGTASPIVITMPAGVAATFTMTATNSVGTSPASPASNSVTPTASATVPATMTAPVATASAGSVSVAYTAPSDGGSAITAYTATWSGGQSVTGTANPLVITGITNGVAGTVTIYATNSVGNGTPSPASNSVTPQALTVPGAPTIGTALAGDGYIDVAFAAPGSNGGSAILDYTATLSTGQTATGATSPIRVTAVNGTPATATVTARNAQGSSAASAASNSVTPAAAVAATVYDFEADTVGAVPAGMTVALGALAVADTGVAGWTGKYVRFTGNSAGGTYSASLDNIQGATDRTLTWQRGVSSVGFARDGMILRAQAGTVTGYPGFRFGYLFQINGSGDTVRLYKAAAAGLTQIGTTVTLADALTRHFRASAIGTTLKLEYSADGTTWTTAFTLTDSTYTSGGVDYINGFAGTPNTVYIDNVAWA